MQPEENILYWFFVKNKKIKKINKLWFTDAGEPIPTYVFEFLFINDLCPVNG